MIKHLSRLTTLPPETVFPEEPLTITTAMQTITIPAISGTHSTFRHALPDRSTPRNKYAAPTASPSNAEFIDIHGSSTDMPSTSTVAKIKDPSRSQLKRARLAVDSPVAELPSCLIFVPRVHVPEYQFPATGLPMAALRALVSDGNLGSYEKNLVVVLNVVAHPTSSPPESA
jgi:hypothetical protein